MTCFAFVPAFQWSVKEIKGFKTLLRPTSREFFPHPLKTKAEGKADPKVCAVERIHLDSFWEVTFHLEEDVRKESYSGINCYGIITQL